MAAIGTVLSVAQTLFASLQCSELKEIWCTMGYKSQLEALQRTVYTVRAVLLDAESKQELSHEANVWIEELKDAIYDADDLLDEFLTLFEQKQLMVGGKLSKEVRLFFSRFNQLRVAHSMSKGVKRIRKQLDAITSNHSQFGLSVDYQPIRTRREETCSYVRAENVIGREDERKAIVEMLLDNDTYGDVCFVSIVGIGGMGKTTLAQLVYNDERIKNDFSLRLWACVSDQDQRNLDRKAIFCKILESATGCKPDISTMDRVQVQLREQLEGKKYLLVLDDVWNENRDEWLKLGEFLMGGGKGSRIVVTTRSKQTARVIGHGPIYELQGLSDDNSWILFHKTAFDHEQKDGNSDELVKIGKEIVRKCADVPLAIKVVGSLLYGQGKARWDSFQKNGLAKIRPQEDGIMPILKLSYYHLEPPLKSCFSYCALFPKDFEIRRDSLISLWMAQGCIVPLDEGQSVEDAGEEYFLILLRRCFFQDIREDEYGQIISCKIHDLMDDIAEGVAGKDIVAANCITRSLNKNVRHLSLSLSKSAEMSYGENKFRTYLHLGANSPLSMGSLLSSSTCLRALDVQYAYVVSLPSAIGNLLHLRYLNLTGNWHLETLPESISKLHNLQTLKLRGCSGLKELPKHLSKLTKLRVLDTEDCTKLTHMPSEMGKLSHLHMLTMFVVGSSKINKCGSLTDLKALRNLSGHLTLCILMPRNVTFDEEIFMRGGYLRNKEHIKDICVKWLCEGNDDSVDQVRYEEALFEELQPHVNLRGLTLNRYGGVTFPSWAAFDNLGIHLLNLVKVSLICCRGWQYLPPLGKLCCLKSLELVDLCKLENMENTSSIISSTSNFMVVESPFFPSLEELKLDHLPKLKGWWPILGDQVDPSSSMQQHLVPSFPRLLKLTIRKCPFLTFIPFCPQVEQLEFDGFNSRLQILEHGGSRHPKLKKVYTSNLQYLNSQPLECFYYLTEMDIRYDKDLESLLQVEKVFQSCSASVRSLTIFDLPKLRSLSGGLDHLTALQSLKLFGVKNLIFDEQEDGMPWRSLNQCLLSLELYNLPNLVNLPKGMQYLTALQTLRIYECWNLKGLPEWIDSLSSIQSIQIALCSEFSSLPEMMRNLTCLRRLEIKCLSPRLQKRCQNPDGEDWPKIQHIPHVLII